MKKRFFLICTSLLLIAGITNSYASSVVPGKAASASSVPNGDNPRLEEIQKRVYEIRDMDKSHLSRSERKALKKELRQLNKEAKVIKGVYLSVGAIIIIILLLILIL